tara:strand:+ start:338 stop:517 length:180 start_codon:yes stop_codon:yes gene_type:complete
MHPLPLGKAKMCGPVGERLDEDDRGQAAGQLRHGGDGGPVHRLGEVIERIRYPYIILVS